MKSISLFAFLFLMSCGGHNSSGGGSSKKVTTTPAATPDEPVTPPPVPFTKFVSENGDYKITFSALNKKTFKYSATGVLTLGESDLTASVNATFAIPLVYAIQGLFEGECPTAADDRNGDGYVDIQEAAEKLGKKLMDLDLDLNTTTENLSAYPAGNFHGKYTYTRSGEKKKILDAITAKHGVMDVDLEKSVVLVQGLPSFFKFPHSVESADSRPVSQTLPVACGKVSKI